MATYLVQDYDVFSGNFVSSGNAGDAGTRLLKGDLYQNPRAVPSNTRSGQDLVRRPHRGIQVKEECYATIAVFGRDGQPHSTRNSSSWDNTGNAGGAPEKKIDGVGWGDFYANFILQSVSEERAEKSQTISTFGPATTFFFGENPRFKSFSAILVNTRDFQWQIEWWQNYEELLRGTRLVERMARAYVTYDDEVVEGYLVSAGTSTDAQNPGFTSLRFTMFVTNQQYLKTPGANTPDWPVTATESPSVGDPGYEASTSAVRRANIAALQKASEKIGLLGALKIAWDAFQDPGAFILDQLPIADITEFLLGKNMVVPAGFFGSDAATLYTGLDRAAASELAALGLQMTIRIPQLVTNKPKVLKTFYDGNIDEYPLWMDGQYANNRSTVGLLLAEYVLPDTELTARFMEALAKSGATSETQSTGATEALRLAGRAIYGTAVLAVNYGYTEAAQAQDEQLRESRAAALTGGA